MVAQDFKKEDEGETFDDEDELEDWAISKNMSEETNLASEYDDCSFDFTEGCE